MCSVAAYFYFLLVRNDTFVQTTFLIPAQRHTSDSAPVYAVPRHINPQIEVDILIALQQACDH